MKRVPKVAKETMDKYAILGMLSHEPKYGYDLREEITQTIGMFWPEISFSKIYPMLKKLERGFLVTKKEVKDPQGVRPSRKMYSITRGGKEVLQDWLADSNNFTDTNNMFMMLQETLLKVYFGAEVGSDEVTGNLENLKKKLSRSEKMLKFAKKNLEDHLERSIDHNYYLITVEMGLVFSKVVSQWIEQSKQKLEKLE